MAAGFVLGGLVGLLTYLAMAELVAGRISQC
jgi:hypothetical protein